VCVCVYAQPNTHTQITPPLPPPPLSLPPAQTHHTHTEYNGASQYLIDLVRHRLIFDSIGAQSLCLTAICQDPTVVVVRIANSQHCDKGGGGGSPSHVHGNFEKPCVTVYFILISPEAVGMGVSGHVLELELVLKEIWKVFVTCMCVSLCI